jgi:hypothetical protein
MSLLFKIVHAADSTSNTTNEIFQKIVDNIIAPAVMFIFALATLIFIWGLIGFFMRGDDEEARKTGQNHILWGVVGMAIMVSVYGIVRFVFSSVGQTAPF